MVDINFSEAWLRDQFAQDSFSLWQDMMTAGDCGRFGDYAEEVYTEYPCQAGRIDLLLVGKGLFVVAEFKRECAGEGAVAQVLRYATCLCFPGIEVRACCVAPSFTDAAKYAAAAAGIRLLKATIYASTTCEKVPTHDPCGAHKGIIKCALPQSALALHGGLVDAT